MATKKSKSGIAMAQEIRDLIGPSPKMTAKETLAAIQEKHPGAKINEKSFGVAFYNARKALGISSPGGRGGKKVVKKKLPSSSSSGAVAGMGALQAAVKLLSEAGSVDQAIAAIRSVQSLQIK